MSLAVTTRRPERSGDERGRIVLLHGFTQNAGCWRPFDLDLATDHEVVAVDLPGHGRSGHDDADLDAAAELVAEVGGRAHYVGYSMGGRVLLHLALARPDLVETMTVVGAHPGLETDEERSARRTADDALADRLEEIGVESFLDAWLANPLFAGLTEETAHRSRRLLNRADGLASSLRHTGTGTQRSLWSELVGLEVPTLVLAGADDPKFVDLGERLAATIGSAARFETVEGSGHTCPLEQPAETARILRRSLG